GLRSTHQHGSARDRFAGDAVYHVDPEFGSGIALPEHGLHGDAHESRCDQFHGFCLAPTTMTSFRFNGDSAMCSFQSVIGSPSRVTLRIPSLLIESSKPTVYSPGTKASENIPFPSGFGIFMFRGTSRFVPMK